MTDAAAVDLRALVEDHGAGRSLLRIHQRLRIGVARVVIGIAAVGSLATVPLLPAGSMVWMPLALISLVAIAALAYGVRMTAGAAALVNEVLTELILELQASELGSPAQPEASVVTVPPASRLAFVLSSEVMPDPDQVAQVARPRQGSPRDVGHKHSTSERPHRCTEQSFCTLAQPGSCLGRRSQNRLIRMSSTSKSSPPYEHRFATQGQSNRVRDPVLVPIGRGDNQILHYLIGLRAEKVLGSLMGRAGL